tara:strand:+ start:442 stop:561 length:120 start_codon:yes stop_codon:yes gene_type:complete
MGTSKYAYFDKVTLKEVHTDSRLYAASERFIHQSVDGTN